MTVFRLLGRPQPTHGPEHPRGCAMRLLSLLLRAPASHPWRSSGVLLALVALSLAGYKYYLCYLFSYHQEVAAQAEERFDFEGAREHLAVCLALRPEDRSARLLAARALRSSGRS